MEREALSVEQNEKHGWSYKKADNISLQFRAFFQKKNDSVSSYALIRSCILSILGCIHPATCDAQFQMI